MRPIILTAIFALLIQHSFSQNFWAKKQAGGNVDETLDIDIDPSNNTYVTGYFSSVAEINNINLSVQGLTDIFVSKVLPNGDTDWAKAFGGAQSDRGLGITYDQAGNVIVCGFYTGTVNFGNGVSLTSNGGQDAFVLKLDGAGNPIWARTGGSSGSADRANAVAVDSEGNVIITGQFSGNASFGSINLDASDGTNDAFIAKYDSNGNEVWAKQGTGESLDRGLGVVTTSLSNDVYAIGQFSGDVSFDNAYSNTVQNAFYIIKYSSAGNEEWFRWGGGSEESISYGITSNGDDVIYLTGDYGTTLNLFGTGSTVALTSGFDNSIFILSLSESGNLLWEESAGSTSRISSRGIDAHFGQLSIAGWFECTFDQYSDEYGEATFNSLGFRDAFTANYSSTGSFEWARNFGANADEQCNSIALTNGGSVVLAGTSEESDLIVPVTDIPVSGLTGLIPNQNSDLNYCGDSNYGNFRKLEGSGGLDGFALKAIVPERSPMDFYQRSGSGCDLSIPEACVYQNNSSPSPCPESVIGCPPLSLTATNFTLDEVGYGTGYAWSISGSNDILSFVNAAGTESVTITSQDGCYSSMDDIEVEVYPQADIPLITDSKGVNISASFTSPVFLCPGESVDISAEIPDGYTFQWTGSQLSPNPSLSQPITASQTGLYTITVTSPEGCTRSNFISVYFYELPEDVPPLISFPTLSDTIEVCDGGEFSAHLLNELTLDEYPTDQYDIEWFVNEESFTGFDGNFLITVGDEGWYVVSVELISPGNPCITETVTQFDLDSIYVEILPAPDVYLDLTGPEFYCPGDTLVFYLESEGDLFFNFEPYENFGDSLYVTTGAGYYEIAATSINEFGCTGQASDNIVVEEVQTPEILTNPAEAIVCPGDSVEVFTSSPGAVTWQGPSGTVEDESSIFVQEPGLYFAEVEFYEGCALVSNTIEVSEFATPFLDGSNAVLCPEGEVEIEIVSSALDSIEWQAPFSGSDSVQTVTEPGIYSVLVTGCDVVTELTIEVELTEYTVEIEVLDPGPTCEGDSILIAATPGLEEYQWNPIGSADEVWFTEGGIVQVVGIDEYGCELISNQIEIGFEPIPPLPQFDFTPVCEGEPFSLEVSSELGVNFLEEAGGEIISTENVIFISEFFNDTTFYVYLSSEFCNGPTDSITIGPKPFPDSPILATDAPVCTGTSLSLEVLNAEAGVNYIWLTATGNILEGAIVSYGVSSLDQEGEYLAYANQEDCLSDTVGIDVSLFQTRQVTLPPDTALCFFPNFIIEPDTLYQTYQWFDGSSDSLFIPDFDAALSISLTTTDFNGCRSADLMLIDFADCIIQIPNIITPNGDGLNDRWVIGLDRPQFFDVVIYNRWGRVVYESKDFSQFWDGTHYKSGKLCSEGVYFYIIRVNDFEGRAFEQQGDLTVIRD